MWSRLELLKLWQEAVSLGDLVQMQILMQWLQSGTWDSAFLTSSLGTAKAAGQWPLFTWWGLTISWAVLIPCPQFWVTMKGTRTTGEPEIRPGGLCQRPREKQNFFSLSFSQGSSWCFRNWIWAADIHSLPWLTPCFSGLFSSFQDAATSPRPFPVSKNSNSESKDRIWLFLEPKFYGLGVGEEWLVTYRRTVGVIYGEPTYALFILRNQSTRSCSYSHLQMRKPRLGEKSGNPYKLMPRIICRADTTGWVPSTISHCLSIM